ncbi:MAG TPA: barstar family protein [Frankiaceae bacterium]|nr:barstar family protein [Frankiaceae bacterium]
MTGGAWLLLVDAEPQAVAEAAARWSDTGLVVRVLRGQKMRTWQGLFDETAAALQFPWYFGENLDALFDCITDLDWLPRAAGYVLVINHPDEVLADAGPGALHQFATLLGAAREQWTTPVEQGESWDRPAVPFHVVMHATSNATAATHLWTAAGGTVVPFPSDDESTDRG